VITPITDLKRGLMYSTKEAAKKLGVSQNQVRYLLAKGEIEGKKLGHDWVVLSLNYKRKRRPKTKKND
jgi:excisionase family DNA binding protein